MKFSHMKWRGQVAVERMCGSMADGLERAIIEQVMLESGRGGS